MAVPDIVKRYEGNPIIKPEDVPGGSNSVFNSAVVKIDDYYQAILRIENKVGSTEHRLARSDDGIRFEIGDEIPHPDPETEPYFFEYEKAWYDPRMTEIDGVYYIAYCIENQFGAQCLLMKTEDFKKFERVTILSPPDSRNVVLFPEKIGGMYYRFDRPNLSGRFGIWMASSPDLIHWGNYRSVLPARVFYWDGWKCGAGAPPIRTDEGWLEIYHGCHKSCSGLIYRLGVALLDLEEPWKVIRRAENYILGPTEDYERTGDVPNVCFINAAVVEPDGEVKIYYGGADTVLCLATAQLGDLVDFALTY